MNRRRVRDHNEFQEAFADFREKVAKHPRAGLVMAVVDFPDNATRQMVDCVNLDTHAGHYIALADVLLEAALERWKPDFPQDRKEGIEAARRALALDVKLGN